MSGPVTIKIEGLRELDAGFRSLVDDFDASKATVKNTMRRGLSEAIEPMADVARNLAPDDPETGGKDLQASITVGTRLTPRQRALAKAEPKSFVVVYMGTADPAGVQQEFGNVNHGPQSFMRPSFQQEAMKTIERVAGSLRKHLDKAISRARSKTLKKAS